MKSLDKKEEGFCVKCGTCSTVCPVYLASGNEIHTPRGKQHLVAAIAAGEASAHYAEIFSQCLLCGACADVCPRGLDTPELVIRVRSELPKLSGLSFLKYVSRQALIHPSLLSGLARAGAAADSLLGEWLPQDSGMRLRLRGFARETFRLPRHGYIAGLQAESGEEKEESGRTAPGINFFTGCLANHLQPEIAAATQFLLARSTGAAARVPQSQTCCGMAALAAGRLDEARDLAQKNITVFEANDQPILTSCSSCYYQLKSYGELFADDPEWRDRAHRFGGRLQEFSTYFLEKFSGTGELLQPAGNGTAQKVVYHDPCHLRYKLQVTAEPRQLIGMLPEVELQEMPGGPQCCGQGGLFQVAHPRLSLHIRERLMAGIAGLGAEIVLTACSGCLLQWQQGLAEKGEGCKAEHLAVFIARHLQ